MTRRSVTFVVGLMVALIVLLLGACGRSRPEDKPGVTPVPTWTPTARPTLALTTPVVTPTAAPATVATLPVAAPVIQPVGVDAVRLPAPLYFIDHSAGQILRLERAGDTFTPIAQEQEPVLDAGAAPAEPVPSTLAPLAESMVISTAIGRLTLPDQMPTRLVLDQDYVYWMAHPGYRAIHRYPLRSVSPTAAVSETVATTRYPQGVLGQFPIIHMGEWLVFFDSAYNAISDRWALRALNVATLAERTIAESPSGSILHGFAADHQRVVWTAIDHVDGRACVDESVLLLYDFQSGMTTALDRACSQTDHLWRGVGLADEHLVAELLYQDAQAGNVGDIVLFDLSAAEPKNFLALNPLVNAQRMNNSPAITGDWVLWMQGGNDFGDPILWNLRTKTSTPLPTANAQGECQYLHATAQWIFGVDCDNWQRLLLYQLDRQQVVRIVNTAIGRIGEAAVFGNVVVITGQVEPGTAKLDSVIAWYEIAQ